MWSRCGIQAGMEIADLGAGSGFYTIAAAKALISTGRVYAVDAQKDLLTKIKNNAVSQGLYNVEVIWGDIEKPPAHTSARRFYRLGATDQHSFSIGRQTRRNKRSQTHFETWWSRLGRGLVGFIWWYRAGAEKSRLEKLSHKKCLRKTVSTRIGR
jgi:SAM-dependent methyltransferase